MTTPHSDSRHTSAPVAVHLLIGGRTICGMTGLPKDWEEGAYWVRIEDRDKVSCRNCKAGLELKLPPARCLKDSSTVAEYLANSHQPLPDWMLRDVLSQIPGTHPPAVSGTERYAQDLMDRLAKRAHSAKWGDGTSGLATYDRVWKKLTDIQREEYRRIVREVLAVAAAEPDGLECLRLLVEKGNA